MPPKTSPAVSPALRACAAALTLTASAAACAPSPSPARPPEAAPGDGVAPAAAALPREPAPAPEPAGAAAPAPATTPARPLPPLRAGAGQACGPFECFWTDSGPSALAVVLADQPLALGVGEAHALAGSESVASSARRFTAGLLPELKGVASHLVVELLQPDPRCESATREVRRAQQPVTAPQAKTNQDDYVELGRRARGLGIEPFVLSPTCDEYRAIAGAGDAAIDQMLGTIARVTSRMLRAALVQNRADGRGGLLVIGYGGALHNDIAPSAEKAAWSYGPELAAFTGGRYVELDLIVREFIKDTDVWKALPWYAHFDPGREPSRWLVMRTAPHRYALFFPSSEPSTSD